jgi:uncharacterized protein (TIGR02757 family)
MKKQFSEWKLLLDPLVEKYDNPAFIELDPIRIPHQFSRKEDVEISAFLASTIAWGNRKSIINNASSIITLMDAPPLDFILNFSKSDEKRFENFVHRTFNSTDLLFFFKALKNMYKNHDGIEGAFMQEFDGKDIRTAIAGFRNLFFEIKHEQRTTKHVSNPLTGSAAKRLNMHLRWMVRPNNTGVDFGIWKDIPTSVLSIPLDVHSGRVARELGMLKRTQDDWKAVEELDQILRQLDPNDPVKYDFALFGSSVQ